MHLLLHIFFRRKWDRGCRLRLCSPLEWSVGEVPHPSLKGLRRFLQEQKISLHSGWTRRNTKHLSFITLCLPPRQLPWPKRRAHAQGWTSCLAAMTAILLWVFRQGIGWWGLRGGSSSPSAWDLSACRGFDNLLFWWRLSSSSLREVLAGPSRGSLPKPKDKTKVAFQATGPFAEMSRRGSLTSPGCTKRTTSSRLFPHPGLAWS